MNKLAIALLAILALAGCKGGNDIEPADYSEKDFSVVCLNGVNYYMRAVTKKGYMAPVIVKKVTYDTEGNEVVTAEYSFCN